MRFLAASLREPLFREQNLALEKEVVLGEYDRAESSPFFGLDKKLTSLLYPGQASRKDTHGDRTAVAPIPEIPPLERNEAVIDVAQMPVATVLVQWRGPSASRDPDATFAADVFSDALNTPGSGFLKRLVDSGLWQEVGVNYDTLNHVGPITIRSSSFVSVPL